MGGSYHRGAVKEKGVFFALLTRGFHSQVQRADDAGLLTQCGSGKALTQRFEVTVGKGIKMPRDLFVQACGLRHATTQNEALR